MTEGNRQALDRLAQAGRSEITDQITNHGVQAEHRCAGGGNVNGGNASNRVGGHVERKDGLLDQRCSALVDGDRCPEGLAIRALATRNNSIGSVDANRSSSRLVLNHTRNAVRHRNCIRNTGRQGSPSALGQSELNLEGLRLDAGIHVASKTIGNAGGNHRLGVCRDYFTGNRHRRSLNLTCLRGSHCCTSQTSQNQSGE